MVGYVSVPVPSDGFIRRLNLVVQFGKRKLLSGNTAEIDGPSVCLLQKYWSDFKRVFSRFHIFVFHQQTQNRLVSIDYCSLE